MKQTQFSESYNLASVKNSYYDLLESGINPISLHSLFSGEGFSLNVYCKNFYPHPELPLLVEEARNFSNRYGIWLKTAEVYITCAAFLFPNGNLYRMIPILKNCAVDFCVNDLWGRELFRNLDVQEQGKVAPIIARMSRNNSVFNLCENPHPIEIANREMMLEIKSTSSTKWFDRFSKHYNLHLAMAHKDCEIQSTNQVPNMERYIQDRCHISGMYHTIDLIEYAEGLFLDYSWIRSKGLYEKYYRLRYLIAAFGCLTNDFFSLEREVIQENSDSNYIAITALQHPEWSFSEVIAYCGREIQMIINEFISLCSSLRYESYQFIATDRKKVDTLEKNLQGLNRIFMASWVWQYQSPRYKYPSSIFLETTAKVPAAPSNEQAQPVVY